MATSTAGNMHLNLFRAYQKCYPRKTSQVCQAEVNKIWSDAKAKFKSDKTSFDKFIYETTNDFNVRATNSQSGTINKFFSKVTTKDSNDVPSLNESTPPTAVSLQVEAEPGPSQQPDASGNSDKHIEKADDVVSLKRTYSTPAQEAHAKKIAVMESELNSATLRRDTGLATDDEHIDKKIRKLRDDLKAEKLSLQAKVLAADRQKKYRVKQRTKLQKIMTQFPAAKEILKIHPTEGRPRLESNQEGLLEAIIDIAITGSSADDRRRSEVLRTCKTLDDLTEALQGRGFQISRMATYLRLIPRNATTIHGKRHVNTVPVKLSRAQTDVHKGHVDQPFCKATVNSLESLASALTPTQVGFISQDDKARVPIGLTAAKVQAPALMHMEYKVRLPDHDWVVAGKHKLIPSVYAGIEIKPNGMGREDAVTYSGPTYIAIRSAKHSSSTAASHAYDFKKMVEMDEFAPILKTEDGLVKPVLIIMADGGPDKNPRYSKLIGHAADHFREFDLDAIFVCTNAPGRSAFNRVERRMAPLSRELSGLIIPHDHFGNHLNSDRRTIDTNLEIRNFEKAGNILAEVWNSMNIDGFNVTAEYVAPDENVPDPLDVSHQWYVNHIRESQYMLQIIKCSDRDCCKPFRSDINKIIYQRFLTAPYPVSSTAKGIIVPLPEDHKDEKFAPFLLRQSWTIRPPYPSLTQEIPYDYYCPSVREDIESRQCELCGVYFASKSSLGKHRKGIHKSDTDSVSRVRPLRILSRRSNERLCLVHEDSLPEWIDVEEIDIEDVHHDPVDEPPNVITNIEEWVKAGTVGNE